MSEEFYVKTFEPEFAAGNDILYVHFSAATSNTFNIMEMAVNKLLEKYPGRKFTHIDTKGITALSYNIVLEIADLLKAGKTVEEIVEWAKVEVPKFPMYFFADDLKFFRRSGRVSGLAAAMGTLIGVRPIIHMSQEGKMVSVGTETGRLKAMTHLVDMVAQLGDNIHEHRICIGHTDAPHIAHEVGKMIENKFGPQRIEYVDVNPTAGSHCGPNGVGVCFHAIHR
jgi:DegV family protein with EDD domain